MPIKTPVRKRPMLGMHRMPLPDGQASTPLGPSALWEGERMPRIHHVNGPARGWAILAICLACAGCALTHEVPACIPDVPHELKKVTQPPYVIEPPDTLLNDAIRLIPRPPYRVEPLDTLGIQVTNTLPNAPISGIYGVEPDGAVNLGFTYGAVNLLGQTLPEARASINRHCKGKLKPPFEVTVVLSESRALQQIRGEHLVRPDGTVSLGTYGSVFVDGLTIAQAKEAIESHLSRFLLNPEISLDVAG